MNKGTRDLSSSPMLVPIAIGKGEQNTQSLTEM